MIREEALEYLVNLGREEEAIIQLDQGTYSKVDLNRVSEPRANVLGISTLTGLVDYIKSSVDKLPDNLIIHVDSYDEVSLYSPLNQDRAREEYIKARAILPRNIRYDDFISTEQFNIMLQSSFVDNEDKAKLLKYTSLVRDEAVKEAGDDGVSQQVTVKTGIASVGQAVVPNPVVLAPFRTFQEVLQPESKFIFRMKEGLRCAIFEADGGAWRNEAIKNIRNYLAEELKDMSHIQIIA